MLHFNIYRVVDVDGSDDKEEVKSYSYTAGDKEWTCLQEGEYEFIISGWVNPRLGDCEFKEGDYTIITLDGIEIEEQTFGGSSGVVGSCEFLESIYFSMPYAIAPSMKPSTSMNPTLSLSQLGNAIRLKSILLMTVSQVKHHGSYKRLMAMVKS